MKLAFISPRPFGLMGTPGTYLLVEAYTRFAQVCVITNEDNDGNDNIVASPPECILLYKISSKSKNYYQNILEILILFDPDIINITSHRGWNNMADFLKDNFPQKKIVFDIKSPLLEPAISEKALRNQLNGLLSQRNVDLVLTRSPEDVKTWIPCCSTPVIVYPLGTAVENYTHRIPEQGFASCSNFVYIGSLSPLREINKLVRYISFLPKEIKDNIKVDIFGSGSSVNDLLRSISEFKLKGVVNYRGCVDAHEMAIRLPQYDAGIAWVPELYDTAPSLKVVEMTCAGILPIAMDTTAHRRFAGLGFEVDFFSNSSKSFAAAIKKACYQGYPKASRVKNLKESKKLDWNIIVDQYIQPNFFKCINGDEITSCGLVDQRTLPMGEDKLERILFITPRPFGLMGTPGTYLLSESYKKFTDLRIVSNKKKKGKRIVYSPENWEHIHELNFNNRKLFIEIEDIINRFDPQVLVIGNYAKWFDIISFVRSKFGEIICVLDIKSPLFVDDGQEAIYFDIQKKGQSKSNLLDLVMTYSKENVETWIPQCKIPVLEYPIGIRIADYCRERPEKKNSLCRRFVFIGTIHPLRQLDDLLYYISKIPLSLRESLIIDFYGAGPALKKLEVLAKELGIDGVVTFKGYLDSTTLQKEIASYDAGIAWVPHGLYENAPSLKLLEYMAAGLAPIAMNTEAHKNYEKEGFRIQFFEANVDSFVSSINHICTNGFSLEDRDNNRKLVSKYDWDNIASEIILPTFLSMIRYKENYSALKEELKKSRLSYLTILKRVIDLAISESRGNTIKLPWIIARLLFESGMRKIKNMGRHV